MSFVLSKALNLIRNFHDLSQKQLAQRLEISKSYLSEIEAGKKQPTLRLLQRYSEVFQVPVSSILFLSETLELNINVERASLSTSPKIQAMLKFLKLTDLELHLEK